MTMIVCSIGCCRGCVLCMGMQIGCHSRPCRCKFPCFCNFAIDEPDPTCRRHLFPASLGIISDRLRRHREDQALSARFDRVLNRDSESDGSSNTDLSPNRVADA